MNGDEALQPPPNPYGLRQPYIRLDDAAQMLSVSKTTVRNLIDEGQLEAGHVGRARDGRRRHLRVTALSMEAYLRRRFPPGETPAT